MDRPLVADFQIQRGFFPQSNCLPDSENGDFVPKSFFEWFVTEPNLMVFITLWIYIAGLPWYGCYLKIH